MQGTLARLLNSSCAPNCEAQKWSSACTDELRIGIFATQDIAAGQELTYDYQFQHHGATKAAKDYRSCLCAASACGLHPWRCACC